MNAKNGCLICGSELIYHDVAQEMECVLCHEKFVSDASCEQGHYICDTCHAKNSLAGIFEVCRATKSRDPLEIMVQLMRQPFIHMHGPEHHILVGSALLAAYHNSGGLIDRDTTLMEMRRRGEQVPGGVCGYWGSCGAAISTGMFISIVTGSTPLKREEWRLSNLMTAQALQAIGTAGGPRCCKRDSFLAVQEAVLFTREHLGVEMTSHKARCEFSSLNAQCIEEHCPFYSGKQ